MTDLGPLPNGAAPQAPVNAAFVALLKRALADAEAGKVMGGALILIEAGNALNAHTALTFPPSVAPMVVAGAEFLKEEIISMVRQQQRGGGRQILRAQGLPS
jgi:hypothetical protein